MADIPEEQLDQFARFAVPCLSPAVEQGLWLSTAGEGLVVGFHTHQTQFTDYGERFNAEQVEAALRHAAQIIAERVGVVSWYRGAVFVGSRTVDLPHPGPLPGVLDGLAVGAELAGFFADCDRATLRSWSGQFDRDEDRAAAE